MNSKIFNFTPENLRDLKDHGDIRERKKKEKKKMEALLINGLLLYYRTRGSDIVRKLELKL